MQIVEAGSPPRVRGTASGKDIFSLPVRITPACAGNRLLRFGQCAAGRDHPRVCGEQFSGEDAHEVRVGSPPRVRGTESGAGMIGQGNRITPACAGNRWLHATYEPKRKDHPRVCGEQLAGDLQPKVG